MRNAQQVSLNIADAMPAFEDHGLALEYLPDGDHFCLFLRMHGRLIHGFSSDSAQVVYRIAKHLVRLENRIAKLVNSLSVIEYAGISNVPLRDMAWSLVSRPEARKQFDAWFRAQNWF